MSTTAINRQEVEEDICVETRHGDACSTPSFLFRTLLHKDAKLSKLNTREDPYGLHKCLGMLSLASFFYRYGYVYPKQGNLGFDSMYGTMAWRFDMLSLLVHTLLAFSSIIFKVPRKRLNNKPMIIYEEYRQHAMVFTFRCFAVFLVATVFPDQAAWLAPVVVFAHHLLADRITSIHGIKGNTAVRATAGTVHKYAGVSKLYSFYQFLAIASHILPSARLADLGFNATIAIQSSAFMMTLYRKRIVRGRTHMIVYSLCLVVSGFHIVRLLGLFSSALVAACFLLRINLPREWSNKYVCWTLFLAAYNYQYIYQVYIQGLNVEELVELPTAKGTFLACMLYALYISERRVNQNAPSTTN